MNSLVYDQVSNDLLQLARNIELSKRPGYTGGSPDVLKNFKGVADSIPVDAVTPGVAWVVYAKKHFDAIVSILTRPDLPVSEDPLQRFADLINYTKLGYALYVERTDGENTKAKDASVLGSHVEFRGAPAPHSEVSHQLVEDHLAQAKAVNRICRGDWVDGDGA